MSISEKYKKSGQKIVSEDKKTVSLTVKTSDPAAEIFILNYKLDLVTRGAGSYFQAELEPGIYKIKVSSGLQVKEELITLNGKEANVSKNFKLLAIASPAPINDSALTHEFHTGSAQAHSKNISAAIKSGIGSAIYIFARSWTSKVEKYSENLTQNPALGLTLHDEKGNLIADIEKKSLKGSGSGADGGWDPWAACLIKVNPGGYRLRLTLADGTQIEQTIVAAENWQTQMFFLQHNYENAEKSDWRADLAGASILMSSLGRGFDAGEDNLRIDECARIALANNQKTVSDEIRNNLLHGKFENPMFGIYGAHLLLMDQSLDLKLLNIVVGNLRRLVGKNHPDVEALAIKINAESDFTFNIPPMLRRSWGIVVGETFENPNLVPLTSLAAKISTRIWGSEPFLLWLNKYPNDKAIKAQDQLDIYKSALMQRLKMPVASLDGGDEIAAQTEAAEKSDFGGGGTLALGSGAAFDLRDEESDSGGSKVFNIDIDKDLNFGGEDFIEKSFKSEKLQAKPDVSPDELQQLVRSLGLPRNTVEKLIGQVKASDYKIS
jgi:hypothetical protein